MRLVHYLTEAYTNWSFPDEKTMKADFSEYKKKEKTKWKSRSQILGTRWPLFRDFNHFRESLRNADVVRLTKQMDRQISHRSHSHSIEDLKDLVNSYIRPRDVDRIVDGFQNNDRIPYPIVLRTKRGMWIMAGNTRLDASFIMDITPIVLIVDVDKDLSELVDLQKDLMPSYLKKPPESTDAPVDVVEKIIRKDCAQYLRILQSAGIGVFWRGLGYPSPANNFGKKAVRKDRQTKGMHFKLAKVFNPWLEKKGHNRRDQSISATADFEHARFFGDPMAIFPIGKVSYTWIHSKDINEPDRKTKFHPEMIWVAMDTMPAYIGSGEERKIWDKADKIKKVFPSYVVTDKRIKTAYDKGYEIWFDCKSYYFVKSGSQMIQSGELHKALGLKKALK